MSLWLFIQSLIDGLLMGGIYSIMAIGLTLIFGVMGIINFAQGALMMLGMYVTYWAFTLAGIDPYLSLPLSAIALFILGALIQKGVLERVMDAPDHNILLITFGIMMIIENTALVLFSPDFRSITVPWLSETIKMGDYVVSKPKLIAFFISMSVALLLYWFLQKSYLGKAIRGTANNKIGAALVGIKSKRINYITFGLGAAIAAIAGSLMTPIISISPSIGHTFILKTFVVVVLGGLGNVLGAFVGGLIIGVSEALAGAAFSGTLNELVIYVIFVLILIFRPKGIFGGGS
ncbi:MAG: branched-chain amino acid ABC transporter permease [Bacilli bacterium]|nr:branched-chain amino acid ABC transporter permease [Bacilli bacterium]